MTPYTVLFVDDEPNILRAMTRLFRGDPMTVKIASSAEEALEILASQPVALLVTDNIMPGMTGVELAKRVKRDYPDVFRIILSGQSDMEAVLQAVNEGEAYRFILKPWNDMDLKATVNLALAHYSVVDDHRCLRRELEEKSRLLRQLAERHPEIFNDLASDGAYRLDEASETTNESVTEKEEVGACLRP